MATIGMRKALGIGFDEALVKVPEALKTEGFGVLTEIDVQDTLKKKIGADIRRYRILGACNPALAHEALAVNLDAGVMMPCNVVVYEGDDGKAVVNAIDPLQTAAAQEGVLRDFAEKVRGKLQKVLATL